MPETADRGGQLTRRRAVVLGLGTLTAACTADPRIGGASPTQSPRPTSRPSPTAGSPASRPEPTPTFAGGPDAAKAELALAGRVQGVAQRWDKPLSADGGELLDRIAAAHRAHAGALTGAEPTARPTSEPTTTSREPTADSLGAALDDLASREQRLAAAHRARALAASGFNALLWGSLSVAATAFTTALPLTDTRDVPAFAKTPTRHDLPTLTDTAALQDLIAQLHAAVYGYQLAIGQLESSAAKDRALSRLRAHRRLRDRLLGTLTARSATLPVPAPAYEPAVRPTSPARAERLMAGMERALLPFVGLWLASAPQPADRSAACAALLSTDTAARSWGAGLLVWPGWNG